MVGMAFDLTWAASSQNNRATPSFTHRYMWRLVWHHFVRVHFNEAESWEILGNLQRFSPLANMKNDTDGAEKNSPQRQARF